MSVIKDIEINNGSGTPITADLGGSATNIDYDGTTSGLVSTNAQAAIDEVANKTIQFVGTQAQWNALTTEQKNAYNGKASIITDDYSEGSGSGHTIVNKSGTEMEQRSKLKFLNAEVTDDAVNDTTIVEYKSGGLQLDDVSGASVISSHTTATITWTDPTDITADSHALVEWKGTLVVRKVGSAPTNKNDGTVVVDSTTRNQYSSNGYADTGLSYDTTYYYRFFPYSKQNIYTDGSSVYVVPERESISTPSESEPLSYTGQVQSANLTGYDSTKMDIADNTAINVGHYLAHVTPKEDYKWSDETLITVTEYIDNVQIKQFTSNGIGNISFDLSSVTDTSSHTGKIVATDGTNSDMIEFTFTKEAG